MHRWGLCGLWLCAVGCTPPQPVATTALVIRSETQARAQLHRFWTAAQHPQGSRAAAFLCPREANGRGLSSRFLEQVRPAGASEMVISHLQAGWLGKRPLFAAIVVADGPTAATSYPLWVDAETGCIDLGLPLSATEPPRAVPGEAAFDL